MGSLNLKWLALSVCGAIFVILGGVLYAVIGNAITNGVKDELVIDSRSHKNYAAWINPADSKNPPLLYKAYLWNMTNPAEVLAGQKPNYQELGPFTYRLYEEKIESTVQYTDNNAKVEYAMRDRYVFEPSLSNFSSDEVMDIVNVNLYYVTLAGLGGSFNNIQFILAAGLWAQMVAGGLAAGFGNTAFCLPAPLNTVCSYAAYVGATGSGTLMNTTQSAGVMATIANPNSLVVFLTAMQYLQADPTSPTGAALLGQATGGWAGFNDYATLAAYIQAVGTGASQYTAANFGVLNTLFLHKRSARQTVFGNDPFMNFLGQPSGVLQNMSVFSYTVRTGADDVDFAGMDHYTRFENKSVINAWQTPFTLDGRKQSVKPLQKKLQDRISLYLAEGLRFVGADLVSDEEEVKGVRVGMYRVSTSKELDVSTYYGNPYQGMIDVTRVFGVPAYLSAAHFRSAPQWVQDSVTGLTPSDELHSTTVYVEKHTGFIIKGKKILQFNAFVNFTAVGGNNASAGTIVNSAVREQFYPLAYLVESAELTDDQASDLKTLQSASRARGAILVSFIIVGVVLIAAGIGMMVLMGGEATKVHPGKGDLDGETPKGN